MVDELGGRISCESEGNFDDDDDDDDDDKAGAERCRGEDCDLLKECRWRNAVDRQARCCSKRIDRQQIRNLGKK
ncbi:hypothetical protein PHSY_001186 [Pseudozyma hubeiensis SY62]|uniref:Uncharacterized protein n=1 Tax=Pseudozyma hubeiensis (strain SY62) TaxID=1305764 RepID=R9NY93_PSEHS|nr:hypothetical protein PHSY_001186 [Pseudozyma hubeiensis SY62]GAC93621.1 hypothetical protein PHSY_001186 [Pseudozyma hubeiensis SY62]